MHTDITPNKHNHRPQRKKKKQCAKHGIYTIIDLHAAPGAQNTDWHSDLGESVFHSSSVLVFPTLDFSFLFFASGVKEDTKADDLPLFILVFVLSCLRALLLLRVF